MTDKVIFHLAQKTPNSLKFQSLQAALSLNAKKESEVKNPWPSIVEAELPGLKAALDKAMTNHKEPIGGNKE